MNRDRLDGKRGPALPPGVIAFAFLADWNKNPVTGLFSTGNNGLTG
jgi:hypothetical protein